MSLYIPFPEWISPVVIPGLPFRWYGLMYLVAFAVAYLLTRYQIRERRLPIDQEDLSNLFFYAILGLLLGARIFATTIYDPTGFYIRKPWLIFWPFDEEMRFTGLQGMSFHGGVAGAAVAILIYCKVKKLDLLEVGDLMVTAIPLGYTFGRIGNFINGELYGRITSVSWGVLFPQAERVPTSHPAVQRVANEVGIEIGNAAFVNLPRHPSQLYEAFLEGVVLWAVMWLVFRNRRPFKGFMVGVFFIGYSIARFIAEYFRQPDPGLDFVVQLGPADNPRWLLSSLLNLTTGQVLSVIMILAGFGLLVWFRALARRQPKVTTFD